MTVSSWLFVDRIDTSRTLTSSGLTVCTSPASSGPPKPLPTSSLFSCCLTADRIAETHSSHWELLCWDAYAHLKYRFEKSLHCSSNTVLSSSRMRTVRTFDKDVCPRSSPKRSQPSARWVREDKIEQRRIAVTPSYNHKGGTIIMINVTMYLKPVYSFYCQY